MIGLHLVFALAVLIEREAIFQMKRQQSLQLAIDRRDIRFEFRDLLADRLRLALLFVAQRLEHPRRAIFWDRDASQCGDDLSGDLVFTNVALRAITLHAFGAP